MSSWIKSELRSILVDGVEPDGCGVELDVELGQLLAQQERAGCIHEQIFKLVEVVEQVLNVLLVCGLFGRGPRLQGMSKICVAMRR
jgi:hypothetical protein